MIITCWWSYGCCHTFVDSQQLATAIIVIYQRICWCTSLLSWTMLLLPPIAAALLHQQRHLLSCIVIHSSLLLLLSPANHGLASIALVVYCSVLPSTAVCLWSLLLLFLLLVHCWRSSLICCVSFNYHGCCCWIAHCCGVSESASPLLLHVFLDRRRTPFVVAVSYSLLQKPITHDISSQP